MIWFDQFTSIAKTSLCSQKRRRSHRTQYTKLLTNPLHRPRSRHRTRRRFRTLISCCRPCSDNTPHNLKLIFNLLFLERLRATRQRTIPIRCREVGWCRIRIRDLGGYAVIRCGLYEGINLGAGRCKGGLVIGAERLSKAAVGYACVQKNRCCP